MFYLNMMVDYPFHVLLTWNYLGHLSNTQGSPFPFCLQLLAQTLDLDLALGFSIKSTIQNMVSISTYFLFVAKKKF